MELTPDQKDALTELINIGYGIGTKLPPRNPRFDFDEIYRFA